MIEAVVHGIDGIRINVTVGILHHNTGKGVTVLFSIGNKGVLSFGCIACLPSDAGIIMIFGIHQHLMFVTEGESLRTQVGGSYRVFCTAGNFTKCRILNCFSGNKCHIMGTCIMIRVMKTVGIDKMCIRTAKCFRTLIH